MADETQSKSQSDKDEALLEECREDFRYVKSYWNENYEEAHKDMDCAAGIAPPEFVEDRKGLPCIWPDEVSQYVKQANNNLRQNKRSIKISPRGLEAKDTDAEHRQAYIQGILYASKAQSIFTSAFESAAECGFGNWRVTTKVTGPDGEQEPRLKRIPNWATVYHDPDAKEADFSDQNLCFVLDTMRQTTFAKRYKNAKKKSFTGADIDRAPDWFNGDQMVVAEWWKRERLDDQDGEHFKVTQRIVSGLEILETKEWIGSWIPIIGVFGEEKYVYRAGQSKRLFLSMVRRARPSQQMLAYTASQEALEFGMAPRAPYMVMEGTINKEDWRDAHKTSKAYLLWKIPANWNPAFGPPPRPERVPFVPNAQAYEVSYERWRRNVQAAISGNPLPTDAQRVNEKSGIALEKIRDSSAIGSFHFTDNFVRALDNTGRQLNELITKLAELDSLPKQVLGKDQKEEDRILHVAPRTGELAADSQHLDEADVFFAHRGQFEVTVSDGPNYQSQREEASEFADTLLQAIPAMGLPPALVQAVLGIAVKLKNIGTYGDEIADLLAPPNANDLPPKAQAILAQAQGQVQMLTAELQKLQMEKMGKVVETQGKMALADKEFGARMAEADKDRETKVLVAEITTKAQQLSERMTAFEDMMKQFHQQAHDLATQMMEQQHEKQIAASQAQAAAAAQASDQAHQATMAAQQPESGAKT